MTALIPLSRMRRLSPCAVARWHISCVLVMVLHAAASAYGQTAASPDRETDLFLKSLPSGFDLPTSALEQTLLREYGAALVTRQAIPPPVVIFPDAEAVDAFQARVSKATRNIGGIELTLQSNAMNALLRAVQDAQRLGKSLTARGSDAARRDYSQTTRLWIGRVDHGLAHWVKQGALSQPEAARIRALPLREQADAVLALEAKGLLFSYDHTKTVLHSVAPPGASQHLALIAVDVTEHDDAEARAILARRGWFQTVIADLPHFTYLGVPETALPGLGLKKVTVANRDYWVPDLEEAAPR